MAKAKYAQTKAHLATAIGISRQALTEISRHPDFPKRTRNGWNVDHAKKFMEKHGRGKHAARNGNATKVDGLTYTQANIRRTFEQGENERIKKERQLVEQAQELGGILDAEEVLRINLQIFSTICALLDAYPDSLDRLLPEAPPAADAWTEIRERAIASANKLRPDAYAVMKELA